MTTELIVQAAAAALVEAADLSGEAPDWRAVARVAVEAAVPLIEARLCDDMARVWDQSPDTVWRGGYVAERTRRWRDNLAELAKLRDEGEASE